MSLKIITSILLLTVVASAVAVPMRFENPARGEEGFFDWENDGAVVHSSGKETTRAGALNILLPSSEQMGADGFPTEPTPSDMVVIFGITIRTTFDPFQDPSGFRSGTFERSFGARIAENPLTYPVGQVVGPGGVIPNDFGPDSVFSETFNNLGAISAGSSIPLGENFLALSFAEFDDDLNIIGQHYGYLGFELFLDNFGFHHVSATRWGYETQLDTAITIVPAPSAAIPLFALVGGVLNRRRRI